MAERKEDKVEVYIPGYVFAAILNTATKCKNHQDGFLLGDSSVKIVDNISDSQPSNHVKEEEITVQHTIAHSTTFSFYNQLGDIEIEALKSTLQDQIPNLLGWYSVRGDTRTTISMREKIIMKNLIDANLCKNNKAIFLLLTPTSEVNQATANILYKCYLFEKSGLPQPIKINVINLGSSALQHREYAHKSRLLGSKSAPTTNFMKTLQESRSESFMSNTGSVSLADNSYAMFAKTLGIMKALKNEVVATNERIERYKNEINSLKDCT